MGRLVTTVVLWKIQLHRQTDRQLTTRTINLNLCKIQFALDILDHVDCISQGVSLVGCHMMNG